MWTVALIVLWVAGVILLARWERRRWPPESDTVGHQHRVFAAMEAAESRSSGRTGHIDGDARPAPSARGRSGLRFAALGALAGLVVVLAVSVVSGGHTPASPGADRQAATTASTPAGTPTSRPRPSRSGGAEHHRPGVSTSTTTTTTPTAQVQTGPGGTITVAVPASTLSVQVTARGPCWVRVQAGATGPTLDEGLLQAGETRTWPGSPGLALRLGNPSAVVLTVNGEPIALPAQPATPIDVTVLTS